MGVITTRAKSKMWVVKFPKFIIHWSWQPTPNGRRCMAAEIPQKLSELEKDQLKEVISSLQKALLLSEVSE